MKHWVKQLVSCLVASVMLMCITVNGKEYKQRYWDVDKNHWAFGYIADLSERNVINGYEDGSFRPEHTVSRAEWSKIMTEAAGIVSADSQLYFADVQGHWALKYINAARGYVTSYSDGTFRPDQAITREDVTVALVRLKGYSTADVDYSYIADFKDADSLSNFAKVFVAVAVEKGLISGYDDKTFRGQGTLTRAEAATLLYRAFQMGSDNKTTKAVKDPIKIPDSSNTSNSSSTVIDSKPEASQLPEILGDSKEETNKAAYRIETLKKANAKKGHSYITTDYKSKIYYVSDNAIYSLDINTKETNKLFDCSELDETEMFNTKNFEIVSICYNQNDGLIYLVGDYNGINSKTSTVATVSPSGNFNLITSEAGYLQSGITAFLSDGVFLSSEYVITAPEFKIDSNRSIGTPTYNNMAVVNNDGTVSSFNILPGDACVEYKYNFSELETPSKCKAKNAGISPYGKVFAIEKQLIIQPNSGAEKQITEKDYEVKDSLPINFSSGAAEFGLMLMQDESVVFYDISAKAFRIVRAQ